MNPFRRHRATSLSMSIANLALGLLQPVTLGDADRADLDAERLAADFGHHGELIDTRRRPDVVIISQAAQVDASGADLQGAVEDTAMVLEAVPGQSSGVVEADRPALAQKLHQRPGQERVL